MKKLKNAADVYVLIIFVLCVSSCVMDWQAEIAIIKNNTSDTVLVASVPADIMTDSILYNQRFAEYVIAPEGIGLVSLPNVTLNTEPDSSRSYLYFFYLDSLNKYQKLRQSKHILKQSLFKKLEIKLNSIKNPIDTTYVK